MFWNFNIKNFNKFTDKLFLLKDYYNLIDKNRKLIINENKKDITHAYKKKIKNNLIERLILDNKKGS